jgi:ABC-type sugar transport system ATPase subunit
VSKAYGAVKALTDVSLDLYEGEVLGLVGENGAGKSTLIGILSGAVNPDQGTLTVSGDKVTMGDPRGLAARGIAVVTQEQSLAPSLRVYENLFLGHENVIGGSGPFLGRRKMRRAARDILTECGLSSIPVNATVSSLTYPQRQLVEIAKAFAWARLSGARPIILLDEPTSGLSEAEVEVLFSLVRRWQSEAAFIFVSHILRDVLAMCTRLVVLKDGRMVKSVPNEDLTDSDLHELMVGRGRAADYYHLAAQGAGKEPDVVLELDQAHSEAFDDVSITVRKGEIVGIAGVVGSGKSEVAAALAGATKLDAGRVAMNGRARRRWDVATAIEHGVFFVPPERKVDSIFPNNSVKANIAIGFLSLIRNPITRLVSLRAERRLSADFAERMAVKTESLKTPLGELSGGNQQKAVFARWLGRECKALILDDPTRGIDVGSREEIYIHVRNLAAQGAAIVLCSESLEEVIGLSDRIVVMKDGRVVEEITADVHDKPSEVDVVRHMT